MTDLTFIQQTERSLEAIKTIASQSPNEQLLDYVQQRSDAVDYYHNDTVSSRKRQSWSNEYGKENRSSYRNKYNLAREMLLGLEELLPAGSQIYILFDSWYASAKLINSTSASLGGLCMSSNPIAKSRSNVSTATTTLSAEEAGDLECMQTEIARYNLIKDSLDEHTQPIEMLLGLESALGRSWGDVGFLEFFIRQDDLAEHNFSRTFCDIIST